MAEDIKVLVERLTARVSTLEGTENFAARFKAQFAASSVPAEFKKAVQGEIAAWKAQQDAAQKLVDPKWVADTVPVTGVKAEATGLKVEGNAAVVEFDAFKYEKALIDVNQIMANREQRRRDEALDARFTELKQVDGTIKASVRSAREKIQTTAAEVRKAARAGDRKLREQITALQKEVNTAHRVARQADRRSTSAQRAARDADRTGKSARTRANSADIKAQKALTQVGEVRRQARARTNEVEKATKAALRQVGTLRGQVEKGMERVRGLESGARSTSKAIKDLHRDLDVLDRSLRR